MKYKNLNQFIPQEKRQEVNNKILSLIELEKPPLTQEEVYNLYTGDGGLHGLNFKDFSSFHSFTEAKKEIEQGQFFTPHDICKTMIEILDHKQNEFIADITCGAGVFFNFLNNQYCYGADIDQKALKVAKFLYPEVNIEHQDIMFYEPQILFDAIIGNPPFNLKWTYRMREYKSQFFYIKKSFELLKPAGVLMFICPKSFLSDFFFDQKAIEEINKQFNFICQYSIDKKAFKDVGVESFETKVMIFQKVSEHLEKKNLTDQFVSVQEAKNLMIEVNTHKSKIKSKITLEIARSTTPTFDYKVKKYLYEIKTHPKLKDHLAKALAYVEKYHTQKPPETMEYGEWLKKHRITEPMVLSYLKRTVAKQNIIEKDLIKVIRFQYGFKIKGYSYKTKKIAKNLNVTEVKKHELINSNLPRNWNQFITPKENRTFQKHIEKINNDYKQQELNFNDVTTFEEGKKFLNDFTFISKGKECKLNDIQKTDIVKIIQKKYSILSWKMGLGKTAASYVWATYSKTHRNVIIVSAALAINLTWKSFLEANNVDYIQIKSISDINNIKEGQFVLLSLEYATKYQKQLKKFVNKRRQNISMVFDESDEITNDNSKRTKAILNIFRRCKRKLLATGTTTRNNISELYSQLELLYNNSYNMICECESIYKEDVREKKIKREDNNNYKIPFPANGALLFKRCFNPHKTTVFGIQKHNQDIYNEEHLRKIIEKTVITRHFKEVAGDKYTINNILVGQKGWEREVYRVIINEFQTIVGDFYKSTGDSRKNAMLRMLQQIELLIKATSTPQIFTKNQNNTPAKFEKILELVNKFQEKTAIGCTTKIGLDSYYSYLKANVIDREIFYINGDVNFKQRESIIKQFEKTENGILLSTQQSLKSSVNIPSCSKVIIESLQWNIPKIEQYYFRFIRFDSENHTQVYFITYDGTIEMNLMALLMAKERLNDYIKTLEFKDKFEDFGIDLSILDSLMSKEEDKDGKVKLSWGNGKLM